VRANDLAVFSVTQIKPLSRTLIDYLDRHLEANLILLEDGQVHGGFGEVLTSELKPRKKKPHFMGYGDHFVSHGTPAELEDDEQVSAAALEKLL
jgi:deoxyxylulose-5-phosphate synthase